MARKKFIFFLLNSSGTPIKTANISKGFIFLGLFIMIGIFSCLGWLLADYCKLRQIRPEKTQMSELISDKTHLITQQRKQIQALAGKLNDLKTNILVLNEFEKKIRVIVNLEIKEERDGLFGVGGPVLENINASLPLSESHTQLLRNMHSQVETVSSALDVQKDNFLSLLKKLEVKRNILAATPSIRPVEGWVTSRFGYRKSPFTNRKEFHKGLDIATRNGTPIIAPADGMVTYTGGKGLMGNMMTINHGYGMLTRYGHLHKFLKKKGEKVQRGETIALVGNTGKSTGPHLHYEVHLNGVPVNPEKYILN
jgi:murein DD-endopeptidase MepM/ murein hydrolase activator NlpD